MTTSYANPGGTGDRTASITVTTTLSMTGLIEHLVNGITSGEFDFFFNGETNAGKVIKFDFGVGARKIIDTFKWYQSNGAPQGDWQWSSSNDDSAYTDRGSSFNITGSPEVTEPAGNTVGARYWKMTGVGGGSVSGSPFLFEIEFKIADAPASGPSQAVIVGF